MKEKYPFLILQNGSNLVRFITSPYQYLFHNHDGINYQPIFLYAINNRICSSCINESNNQQSITQLGWVIGVKYNNTKQILRMNRSLFEQIKVYVKNEFWGDPTKYDFDLQLIDDKINAKAIDNINRVSEKDELLSIECLKLIDPIDHSLSKISSQQEFKNFFIWCKSTPYSNELFNDLIKSVNNNYPQYYDFLKTCLLFS